MGAWQLAIDDARKIVRVTYTGHLDIETARLLVWEARSKAHSLGYHVLYDFSDARITVSLADMYHLPREEEVLRGADARRIRSANVIPKAGPFVDWRFYEITAQNAGLQWRAFETVEEALAWLAEEKA